MTNLNNKELFVMMKKENLIVNKFLEEEEIFKKECDKINIIGFIILFFVLFFILIGGLINKNNKIQELKTKAVESGAAIWTNPEKNEILWK